MNSTAIAWRGQGRPNKFRNVPTVVDGIRFASKREAKRWSELRIMERAGYIADLKRQVRYPIDVNGVPICHYVADFTYQRLGKLIVEDSKGVRTPEYKLKAKLMAAIYHIEVAEV